LGTPVDRHRDRNEYSVNRALRLCWRFPEPSG
jgi:hypothetical protein